MANNQQPPPPQPSGQQPAPPSGTPAPAPRKPRTGLLFSFIGLFFFLFVLFLVFLVILLVQGGGDNPFVKGLGIDPLQLQGFLTTLVSLIFGLFSLIAFIVSLIGFFRWFIAPKAEVEKRKQSLILGVISSLAFFFFIVIWIVLYVYISRLQVGAGVAEIVTDLDPDNTINLTAPITVAFSAREIERVYRRVGIVSYSWDLDSDGAFDDGNGRDIQYLYEDKGNADGRFDVGVKVILGDDKEGKFTRLLTIRNVLPKAVIEYQPKVLEVPVELAFDASTSKDPDGTIVSYAWDFDADGATDAEGPKVKHTFNEEKVQEITLTLTDNNGDTVQEKLSLEFRKGREKGAVITARPGLEGEVPFKVFFDGSNSYTGDRIQSYEWDFGDNSPLIKSKQAQHEYSKQGEYSVRLTISGAGGERYEITATVKAQRATTAPKAVIKVVNQKVVDNVLKGEAPFAVEFDASGSTDPDGKVVDYQWDFDGDGKQDAVGLKATHTFGEGKTYEMTLTVVDDDNLNGTAKLTIEVQVPEILIDLQVTPFSGPVPLEVTFDASASRAAVGKIISYTWNFGDESAPIIGSARQTHIYTTVGEYTVSLTVVTDDGKRSSKRVLVVVREIELLADFTFHPPDLSVGQKVFFDASASQGQISRYYWEFGDGSISRVVKPDHAYEKPGTYKVMLEIYDRSNRVSRKEVEIVVK